MAPEVANLFSFMIEGSREISGTTKGSTGGSDPNIKTFKGQQLSVQRAIGQMTGYFKSHSLALRRFAENAVEQFRANMPLAAYRYIKAPNGEEMKEHDIECFRAAAIGRDILCKSVEGTDIPQAFLDLQENYVTALQLGLFAPPELSGMPPEVQAKMLKLLRIEYDPGNYNDQKHVAYDRLKTIKMLTENAGPEVLDETGQVRLDVLMNLDSQVPFLDRQDAHLLYMQILDAACVAASAAQPPNMLLIRLLQFRSNRHAQAVAMAQAQSAMFQKQISGENGNGNGNGNGAKTEKSENGTGGEDGKLSDKDRLLAEMFEKESQRAHKTDENDKDRELKLLMAHSERK